MINSRHTVIQSLQHHWAATYCKGKRVMYIGCGRGEVCEILAEYAEHVMGVDSSHASIEFAKNAAMSSNVSFRVVVDGTLPFEDASFDVIILPNMIERAFAPKDLMRKIAKILKPEGQLIISTVNRLLRLYFWQKPYEERHFQEYSPVSFEKFLHEYFTEIEMMGLQLVRDTQKMNGRSIHMHKFRHGILNPLKELMLRLFRSTVGFVLPIGPPRKEEKKNSVANNGLFGTEPLEKQSLQEALEQLLFIKDNIEKCTDLVAICRKTDDDAN